MKTLVALARLLFLTGLLVGCMESMPQLKPAISGEPFVQEVAAPSGKGGLYIFRPLFSGFLAEDITRVSVAGHFAENVPFGGYFYRTLPVGKYTVSVEPVGGASELWQKEYEVDIKPNQNSFVAIWASEFVSRQMGLAVGTLSVAPVVADQSSNQSVNIETVPGELAIPEIAKCVSIEKKES